MVGSVNLYGSQGVDYTNLYSRNVKGVSTDDLYPESTKGVSADDLYPESAKGVSFNDLYKKGQDLTGILSFDGLGNIMQENKKTVTIDGETYDVVKVQDRDSMAKTYAPTYKEVVIIDGQQYDVQEVADRRGCDMTKEVVVVDGQQYDVNDSNKLNLLS